MVMAGALSAILSGAAGAIVKETMAVQEIVATQEPIPITQEPTTFRPSFPPIPPPVVGTPPTPAQLAIIEELRGYTQPEQIGLTLKRIEEEGLPYIPPAPVPAPAKEGVGWWDIALAAVFPPWALWKAGQVLPPEIAPVISPISAISTGTELITRPQAAVERSIIGTDGFPDIFGGIKDIGKWILIGGGVLIGAWVLTSYLKGRR